MKRLFPKLALCLLLLAPATSIAQSRVGRLKAPSEPTPIEYRERTISDLLYFPFSCITSNMSTKEVAYQVVTDTFGACESINNIYPGLHASGAFDFAYRGVTIGICFYDWYDNRTWYDFFFNTKSEADQ